MQTAAAGVGDAAVGGDGVVAEVAADAECEVRIEADAEQAEVAAELIAGRREPVADHAPDVGGHQAVGVEQFIRIASTDILGYAASVIEGENLADCQMRELN